MRQALGFFAFSVAFILGATSPGASIFIFDSNADSNADSKAFDTPFLTIDAAQRLLDYRTKPSVSSDLGQPDRTTVDLLNRYGGKQPSLFDNVDKNEHSTTSLVVLHGLDPVVGENVDLLFGSLKILIPHGPTQESYIQSKYREDAVSFDSKTAPMHSSFPNAGVNDNGGNWNRCLFQPNRTNERLEDLQSSWPCFPKEEPSFMAASHAFGVELSKHVEYIESTFDPQRSATMLKLYFKVPQQSTDHMALVMLLESFLDEIRMIALKSTTVTVLSLPKPYEDQGLGQHNKLEGGIPYKPTDSATAQSFRRRSLASMPSSSVCHVSNSSCNDATNACSGHGFCERKQLPGSDSAASGCYVCKCRDTIVKQKDGTTQRLRWGGSACEKQDMSSPFFLIAFVSILVILIVGVAIGMLFKAGQDDLPGVINAGVGTMKAH